MQVVSFKKFHKYNLSWETSFEDIQKKKKKKNEVNIFFLVIFYLNHVCLVFMFSVFFRK